LSCAGVKSFHTENVPKGHSDKEKHFTNMIEQAREYGRNGYCRIVALLREAGWSVSDGRIARLWRREGLKVPQKQPKKGR
jgi:putative transposase